MPKMKTNRAAAKRFKVTGKGKGASPQDGRTALLHGKEP